MRRKSVVAGMSMAGVVALLCSDPSVRVAAVFALSLAGAGLALDWSATTWLLLLAWVTAVAIPELFAPPLALAILIVGARRERSMGRWTLIVAVVGALGVATPQLASVVWLTLGAVLAAGALVLGKGWGRPVPALALAAIVVAAVHAPKAKESLLARPLTLPKPVMTIGEMRDPYRYGLKHFQPTNLYFPGGSDEGDAEFDGLSVRFPSTKTTLRDFIRTIEAQTPLRHQVPLCGTDASILSGGYPMALVFEDRDGRGANR